MPQNPQNQENPSKVITSFKEGALKWLFTACVALVVFTFTSIDRKLDKIDAKFELMLLQINNNTIDIEVLKSKIQNLEKKHSANYPVIADLNLTLFKPEDEIKYSPNVKKNDKA